MMHVFKMRLLHFKRNYQVFALMTLLTLFFVFIFNLPSGNSVARLGWISSPESAEQEALYTYLSKQKNVRIARFDRYEGEQALADMELDYLMDVEGLDADGRMQLSLLTIVEDMAHLELKQMLLSQIEGYYRDQSTAMSIDAGVTTLIPKRLTGSSDKWFDMLTAQADERPTIKLEIARVGTSVFENYDNKLHSMVGFSLMFSMFTLIFSVTDVLTDIKHHAWGRLTISPINRLPMLIGYFAPSVFLGFFQLSLLYLAGYVFFQIDYGVHIPTLLGFLFLYAMTITSMGIGLAAILGTRGQVATVTTILINGTSMLGGCMWPLAIVESKLMLGMAQFVPQKWAIEALEGLSMYKQSPSDFTLQALVLLGMTLIFVTLGVWGFSRQTAMVKG